MTAADWIRKRRELLDGATEPLPDEARMEAYYYDFDRTGCGPVDAVLSAVAVAGKGSHNTSWWRESSDYGYYSNRPGLASNPYDPNNWQSGSALTLMQLTAQQSAERLADPLASLPLTLDALEAVLEVVRDGDHADTCGSVLSTEGYPCGCWKADVQAAVESVLGGESR